MSLNTGLNPNKKKTYRELCDLVSQDSELEHQCFFL